MLMHGILRLREVRRRTLYAVYGISS